MCPNIQYPDLVFLKMIRRVTFLLLFIFAFSSVMLAEKKLTGNVISSTALSTTYSAAKAFDGSTGTYFQAKVASNTWVGLDLGTPHVITKVSWAPASGYATNTKLAVFEGANRADFADAIPLYMITSDDQSGTISSATVNVSRGFRYVRYVSPNGKYCIVSEVEFYGEEGEGTDDVFYQVTNLPLVVIHTDSGKDPVDKVNDLPAHFAVINKDGLKVKEDTGTVRLRGNTSMAFDKKPYRMKFANKTKLCGSTAKAKKWVLINSWDDKTLMRNNVAFEVSRRVGMEYTPFLVPVDVMVNGEFKGTYDLADQVDQHKDRVDIESLESTVVDGDSLTGGYLIESDGNYYAEDPKVKFKTTNKNEIVIKYPDEDDLNDAQYSYIKTHFQTMENALYAKNFTTDGYRKYFDIESFLKYFILEEFAGNPDAFWSTYFYKHRSDDKFYTGPAWDFNLAFDNDYRLYRTSVNTAYDDAGNKIDVWEPDWVYKYKIEDGLTAGDMLNFVNLIIEQDPDTEKELKTMWTNLRGTGLFTDESVIAYVDEQAEILDASQKLNYMRWDVLGTKLFHNPTSAASYTSYAQAVDSLKSFIRTRVKWFDQKLGVAETVLQISISDAGWATLYVPFAFEVPEQMTVFSVNDVEDHKLVFDTIRVAEANKPYLLFAEKGDYEIRGYLTDTIAKASNGLLTGTAYGMDAPVGSYVLQKQNEQLGFYRVNENSKIHVGSGKAYLTLPSSASASPYRAFVFDSDYAVGITTLSDDSSQFIYVYGLSGELLLTIDKGVLHGAIEQRIMQTLGHGIFIVRDGNGTRKIVL